VFFVKYSISFICHDFLNMKPIFILIIALLLGTECIAQSVKMQGEEPSYSLDLFEQINLYRLSMGMKRLRLDPKLVRLAKEHSKMMFRKQQMSHNNFEERFTQADSQLCVENVGWNYNLPQEMFEGWRRSSGHNRNMLKKEVNRAGIAEVGRYVTFFACK